MPMRITQLLDHVPPCERPAPLNDARTFTGLTEGVPDRVVDWALHTAQTAIAQTNRDIAPARFEDLAPGIARSIESISLNLIRFVLGARDTASAVRVSRAQHEATVRSVHLGIPLHRVIEGLRNLGHVWKGAFIALVLDAVPRDEALETLTRVDRMLSTYFDALVDDNARSWAEEHRRLEERRELGQQQLLERIIAGAAVDDATVSDVLGVRPDDAHVGVIVTAEALPHAAPDFDFAAFRAALAEALPSRAVTIVPGDTDTLWAFASGPGATAQEVRDAVAASLERAPGAYASIGLSMTGAEGIRATHLTARAAHDLNRIARGEDPIVLFSDVGLLALAAQTPELARWFVEAEVGPLLEPSPLREELRKTLQTIIGLGGSLVRTAEALYVHRNTITYRLKKMEEVLGRDPLARPVETRTALLLADLL